DVGADIQRGTLADLGRAQALGRRLVLGAPAEDDAEAAAALAFVSAVLAWDYGLDTDGEADAALARAGGHPLTEAGPAAAGPPPWPRRGGRPRRGPGRAATGGPRRARRWRARRARSVPSGGAIARGRPPRRRRRRRPARASRTRSTRSAGPGPRAATSAAPAG